MNENDVILEVLRDMRDEQKEHAKNSSAHREENIKWQAAMDSRTERIEEDLREHKEGVIGNRTVVAANSARIDKLEEPVKAKKYMYKKYMKATGLIAATLGIISAIVVIINKL